MSRDRGECVGQREKSGLSVRKGMRGRSEVGCVWVRVWGGVCVLGMCTDVCVLCARR